MLLIAYRHLHEYLFLPAFNSLNDVEIIWLSDSSTNLQSGNKLPESFQEAIANTAPYHLQQQHTKNQIKYFYFDPNIISYDSLLLLGLSPKKANVFIKYRNTGARFYKADDLHKIFSLTENDLANLKPWVRITIPDDNKVQVFEHAEEPKPIFEKKSYVVDINLADSAELTKLQGIGPVLASRIIKYRNRFGAFAHKEQLLEVIGISKEWFDANQDRILMSTLPVKKINLNTCTLDELKRHAYFDSDKAKTLINFRTHHGPFKTTSDIKKCAAISSEFYQKIEPYISVEP